MIWDISPPISVALAVWPGDTPPSREVLLDMKAGANLTLSTLRATVHLGAHADAPSHYGRDAASIDERTLDLYMGRCRVVRVTSPPSSRVPASALPDPVGAERLLIATGSYSDPERFREDFAALSPQLVDESCRRGVRLIGIDTPSVDLFHDRALEAHHRFLANDMAILEGLVLDGVPEGFYELLALPLRLVGFDASPVRAILRGSDPEMEQKGR